MKNTFKKQCVTNTSQASSQTRPTSSRAALLYRLAGGGLMLAYAQFALSQSAPDNTAPHAHAHHHPHHHHAHGAGQDAKRAGPHAGMRGREHLALLSEDERQQFHNRMHEAKTPEERRAVRDAMHQLYRQRAAASPALTPPANPATRPSAPAIPGG
jgi:hypothetical protein